MSIIAIKAVGEYLGLDDNVAIYDYFCRHYAPFLPTLPQVDRTAFAR